MKFVQAAAIAAALALTPACAAASDCGQWVRLSVSPADKTADVAAALRRRLAAAGAQPPRLETKDGLSALLPPGVPETVLTRPARIEFRLVAKSNDEPGAVAFQRMDGGAESVEPQIILDESRLRDLKVSQNRSGVVIAFRFEPLAAKNLMTATAEGVGRKLAIIVDDRIVVEPIIRAPVASIEGEIAGGFSKESAQQLVDLIRNGRLRAQVAVLSRKPADCAVR